MKTVWERLHTWLRANAPVGYGDLRPGLDEDAIRQAERTMGLKLPDDVAASYRIHDGQGREPGLVGGEGWLLLPLRDVVDAWRRWALADPELAHRLPIAWNRAGDFVFINLDPASEDPGSVMIQRADNADLYPLSPSFSAWLEEFASELADGVFAYSEDEGEVMLADDID